MDSIPESNYIKYSSSSIPWILKSCWLKKIDSEFWFNILHRNISWEKPIVRVYGKNHLTPRETAFIASKGITYKYSGLQHVATGIPSWFKPLLERVNKFINTDFNGCLLNYYRDGNDRMGWHSDDEPELDSNSPIASLSLGSTRDFILKNISNNLKFKIALSDGDLLIMYPPCQTHWLHCLPVRKVISDPRINITFRKYR